MKVILSGIQPTGIPHIGNYFGALKQWSLMSSTNNLNLNFFSIMDLHAITIPRKPLELKQDTFNCACYLLACGIDPIKNSNTHLFIQSHVKQHAELCWIFQTISKMGHLKRMTQFKDKSLNISSDESILIGLLLYPVLMAAEFIVLLKFQ